MRYVTVGLKQNSQLLVVKGDSLVCVDSGVSLLTIAPSRKSVDQTITVAFVEQRGGVWTAATVGVVSELNVRRDEILWWARDDFGDHPLFPI